jgi:NAD(P)-dependent dehydrogenase (short-subunit alcohol dehydrogenase family)
LVELSADFFRTAIGQPATLLQHPRASIAMSRILILGATGSIGRHVLHQALATGHEVTLFVRTPSKLPPGVRERVSIHRGDLSADVPLAPFQGQEALINCAVHVSDGETFVRMVDRLVTCVDLLPWQSSQSAGFWQARRSSTRTCQGAAQSIYRR